MLRLERFIFGQLISQTLPGRVLILLGARRVGKTSLLKELGASFGSELVLSLNGEDQTTLDRLSI
jgi:predicted AAA+ superfamily ATPase